MAKVQILTKQTFPGLPTLVAIPTYTCEGRSTILHPTQKLLSLYSGTVHLREYLSAALWYWPLLFSKNTLQN